MAITATKPAGYRDGVPGSLKFLVRDLAFTGSYQDDGSTSTLLASDVGLKRFFGIFSQSGAAAASALTTANPFACTINSAGTSAEVTLYEDLAAAAAAPLGEKTDNEAFITGQSVRVLIVGY